MQRGHMNRAAAVVAWLVAAFFVSPMSALADDVTEVRYGRVEGRQPTEISSGLLGVRKKIGMAYAVALVASTERVEVSSTNTSFLAGDCVIVEGTGKKATLERAEPKLCGPAAAEQAKQFVAPPQVGLHPQGSDSDACAQAREEAKVWPIGMGRRRALRREAQVCAESKPPANAVAGGAHPAADACGAAWHAVEALPFGRERASARRHAREVCGTEE